MCGEETVLVVDDEQSCRDLHEAWLEDSYDVLTAAGGRAALDLVGRADVVLLDREMPGMNGRTVAERIEERDLGCFVVIVSGVEPDFDIVDLPIDEYLTKPVTQTELKQVVVTMRKRSECQDMLREFYSLAARRATLEVQKSTTELSESEEYGELTAELESKRSAIEEMLEDFDGQWRQALYCALDEDAEGVEEPSSS